MNLPEWTDEGLLPPGRHTTDLGGIYERCVEKIALRDRREELFSSLTVFHHVAKRIVRRGSLWVGGTFVTADVSDACTVDVLILADDWNALTASSDADRTRLYSLLTLEDVIVGEPIYLGFDRMKPVCGEIDGFICFPGQENDWHDSWSSVKGHDGQAISGIEKGYVEVSL